MNAQTVATRLLLIDCRTNVVTIMDGRTKGDRALINPAHYSNSKRLRNDLEFYRRKGNFIPPED